MVQVQSCAVRKELSFLMNAQYKLKITEKQAFLIFLLPILFQIGRTTNDNGFMDVARCYGYIVN